MCALGQIISEYVPDASVPNIKSNCLLERLARRQERKWHKFCASGLECDRINFELAKENYGKQVYETKREEEISLFNNYNSDNKKFYDYDGKHIKMNTSVPSLKLENSQVAISSGEKCVAFSKFFKKCFQVDNGIIPDPSIVTNDVLSDNLDLTFSGDDVIAAVKALNASSFPGPGHIPPCFF